MEAVENHTPEVIIIDEIGTEAECAAARTIAQRGLCVCVDQQALGRGVLLLLLAVVGCKKR